MTATPLDAHASNTVNHGRHSLAGNCPELQRLEITKMYTLTLHKALSIIFGGVLMTNKLTHYQLRCNKVSLCGSLSLISAKRLVVDQLT